MKRILFPILLLVFSLAWAGSYEIGDRLFVNDSNHPVPGAKIGPFGTATILSQIVVYSQSITPVATAAAIGTTSQTFTVTGLSTSDKISVNGPAPTSLCPITGYRVSSANTLQLDFSTLTAAACTPSAGTHTVVAIRS